MAITLVGNANNYNNSGSTALSVTHGLTILTGDVIVAFLDVNVYATAVTDNNSSYPFTNTVNLSHPDSAKSSIWIRVAGASEPVSYNWTLDASVRWSAIISVFRGVNTSSPWDVEPSAGNQDGSSSSASTHPVPTITTNYDNSAVICMDMSDSGNTHTYDSVNNSFGDLYQTNALATQPQCTSWKVKASAGAVGITTVSAASAPNWLGVQMALRIAGGIVLTGVQAGVCPPKTRVSVVGVQVVLV